MKKDEKKLARRFWVAFVAFFCLTNITAGGINIIVDAYGIFGSKVFPSFNQKKDYLYQNYRAFKAYDVTRNSFDTVIMGSSRIEIGFDPKSDVFPKGSQVYNLGIPALQPYEYISYLEHAILNQPQLKRVLIGIDFEAVYANDKFKPGFQEYRMKHRRMAYQDILQYAFSWSTLMSSLNTVRRSYKEPEAVNYPQSGFQTYAPSKKALLAAKDSFLEEIGKDPSVIAPDDRQRIVASLDRELKDIARLIEVCEENDIEFFVFVTPAHVLRFHRNIHKGFEKIREDWLRELAAVVGDKGMYDFSGITPITTKDINLEADYYYETSHFSPHVGNAIVSRLLFDIALDSDFEEFGTFVNPDNVDEHIESQQEKYREWRDSSLERDTEMLSSFVQ
ncbi:MAG: hypothetical protein ACFB9N_14805 [Geitlerinemataceae cyanobacterium]